MTKIKLFNHVSVECTGKCIAYFNRCVSNYNTNIISRVVLGSFQPHSAQDLAHISLINQIVAILLSFTQLSSACSLNETTPSMRHLQ